MAGFSIQSRHVACVRVAIGIAVFDIKNENEVVAVGKLLIVAHTGVPSVGVVALVESSVFLVKKFCRWW